jgi:hypothetical protein
MSQLTVREKEHWKERISRKVDQAMDKLLATTDPGYMDRIREQATQMALESLGIQELEARVAELSRQEEAVQRERQNVYKRMVALLTGRPVEDQTSSYYSKPPEIQQAVAKRRKIHESQLLENDDVGRRLLELRREKEELLDTVWLATSGAQIRTLWSAVTELLQQPPTPFQSEALAIQPESDHE